MSLNACNLMGAGTVTGLQGMHLRHRLSSSSLVVLLQQWAGSEGDQVPQQDVAEQLSLWVDAVDAINVSRALHAIESLPAEVAALTQAVDVSTMDAALQATKADVTAMITDHGGPSKPMRPRTDHTTLDSPDSWGRDDFAAQVQRYLGIQKHMDAKLGALRVQMRQWLLTGTRSMRQLAMLDSVMEQMFHPREQRAWAMLSGYVERRLVYRHKEHHKMLQATGSADEPRRWRQPDGWLWAFEQDLQALLLTEMQARLQPIHGLLEAAHNDKTGQQE